MGPRCGGAEKGGEAKCATVFHYVLASETL
jgi:hypothetical protein